MNYNVIHQGMTIICYRFVKMVHFYLFLNMNGSAWVAFKTINKT